MDVRKLRTWDSPTLDFAVFFFKAFCAKMNHFEALDDGFIKSTV